jgi:hypothetical protein
MSTEGAGGTPEFAFFLFFKGITTLPPYNPAFENWGVIPSYPDYDTSTWGRVLSFRVCGRGDGAKPKIVALNVRDHGYLNVGLMGSDGKRHGLRVARLVLETFIGPCPEGFEARHYPDPTPANCRLINLSWAIKVDNEWDKQSHERASLTEETVLEILGHALSGKNAAWIAAHFGVEPWVVRDILAGKYAKHIHRGSPESIVNAPMKQSLPRPQWIKR